MRDFKGGKPIAYRLTGDLKISCMNADDSSKLLKFELNGPTLNVRPHSSVSQTEFVYHKSPLDAYTNEPFYAIWTKENVSHVYVHAEEELALVNLKKGLVSLFQFKTTEDDVRENDVSGACDVRYRNTSPTSIRKTKANCVASSKTVHFVRKERALRVKVQNHRSTSITFAANGQLDTVESRDYFHIALEANPKIGSSVDSFIALKSNGKLIDVKAAKEKSPKKFLLSLKHYKSESLETLPQISDKTTATRNFKQKVKNLADNLDWNRLGTKEASTAFVQLLPAAREASKADFLKTLRLKKIGDVKVS